MLLLCATASRAQQPIPFRIDGFSDKYYGIVSVADTANVFMSGTVAVYDKLKNKELFHTTSEELTLELHDGNVKANILEAPYGEQSVLIYKDFNFDGQKDFALMDGQNSCYHGPSYQVYLATAAGFRRSAAFTRLAQEYCGMFQVDEKRKRLNTMTKSGCCWHQFSEFEVVQDKPKPVKITESSMSNTEPYFEEVSEQKWVAGKQETSMSLYLGGDKIDTVLSFTLTKNGKQVLIFHVGEENLFYALLKKDQSVEFYYPEVTWSEQQQSNIAGKVRYNAESSTLQFSNEDAKYELYDRREGISRKLGIKVDIDGQTYVFEGEPSTAVGSLSALKTLDKKNLEK
ncbi:XAC2610-related protein [Chitinophaga tropicalis]|uniref:Uncharacterized protein n=1 Tax=Chitinophaga tropicalis TaxID=2683588 RepID=A0A7K1U106_9BACT|nr:hypothetical protein [Chitinophaga tropicalis]MVT08054.1 hypothetical protein [Chitinophaga tropicalis]